MFEESSQLLTSASAFSVQWHLNDTMITTSETDITETVMSVSLSLIISLLIILS